MSEEILPVTKQLEVRTSAARAFRVFTAGIHRWWPPEHHIGKSPMAKLLIEPREGGRWYAVCQDGSECDTGKVLVWDEPKRLVLAWQITSEWVFDPSFVTEIEVRFEEIAPRRTRVHFEHRNLERYGEKAAALRAQLADPKGWNGNLEGYARVASAKAVLFYQSSAEVLTLAPQHFPAHKARLDAFQARGVLLAVGTYANPMEGSMAVFSDRESAEEFIAEDPFVLHGVVSSATIKDWNEILLP